MTDKGLVGEELTSPFLWPLDPAGLVARTCIEGAPEQ